MKTKMNHFFKKEQVLLWGTVIACTVVMVSLCFDNKVMDFDEAYSYATTKGNTLSGICRDIIAAHDTDVPLWYMLLRIWTLIFGESWLAYKLFAVAGNVATMVLGATVVRRNWGYRTSQLFIIATSLAPVMLHVGVNVRMYSWTTFLITASALLIYELVQTPRKRYLWVLLFLTTMSALLSHYFTAFYFLILYGYLLAELFVAHRKEVWKVFACGFLSLVPFCTWLLMSDLSNIYSAEKELGVENVKWYAVFDYAFGTIADYSTELGMLFFVIIFLGMILLRKRFLAKEWRFTFLCFNLFMGCYILGALFSSMMAHFYVPRHVMHGMALMWLGIAILLARINLPAYLSGMLFLITMCIPNYRYSYTLEYETAPYIDETQAFIEEEMEPGDIVIYNSQAKYDLLYGCYMPEQIFVHLEEIEDINDYIGKRVWFFDCNGIFFSETEQQEYQISYENLGHYGFQIIDDCTDFDLLRLEIGGKG